MAKLFKFNLNLDCTDDMKFVWQRSEMGGYTPKGIYQQWVLTHILSKRRWGANAKAFQCLVYYVLQTYRLVSAIRSGKSVLSACKVPQFDGDLGLNISHKNVTYDKKL